MKIDIISQMSGVRSSGVAVIDKISSDETLARVRKIWMSNTRRVDNTHTGMDSYAFGMYAIQPLIGQPEDIARFDIAISLKTTDVDVNKFRADQHDTVTPDQIYPTNLCRTLLKWAWTRKPSQIIFGERTLREITTQARNLGSIYLSSPPLILAADVHIKLARIAAAIATRLFSTTDGRIVDVLPVHVRTAARILNLVYNNPDFGYGFISRQEKETAAKAQANRRKVFSQFRDVPGLARFIINRQEGKFRDTDLIGVIDAHEDHIKAVIKTFAGYGLLKGDKFLMVISPLLNRMAMDFLKEEGDK